MLPACNGDQLSYHTTAVSNLWVRVGVDAARRLLRAPRIPDSIAFDNRNMLLPHAQDKVRRTVEVLQANVGNVNRAQLLHAKAKMAEPVVRALTKTVVMDGRVKGADKLRTMTGNRYSPSSVSVGRHRARGCAVG